MKIKDFERFSIEQREKVNTLSIYVYDRTGIPTDDKGYAMAVSLIYYFLNSEVCSLTPDEVAEKSCLSDELKPELVSIINDALNKCKTDYKNFAQDMITVYGVEALTAFILLSKAWSVRGGYSSTPDGISRICADMLGIKDDHSIADLCTGRGCAIPALTGNNQNAELYCCDTSVSDIVIAAIKADTMGIDAEFDTKDIFRIDLNGSQKFDRLFMDYIIKSKSTGLSEYGTAARFATDNIKNLNNNISGEWFAAITALNCIKDNGKAAVLMSGGSLMADSNRLMREYFIENGLIEKIIYLPARLYEDTMLAKHIIIISHNNKSVRLVDAQKICNAERRRNVINRHMADEIVALSGMKAERAEIRDVTIEQFREKDYNFNDVTYFSDNSVLGITNGVPLSELLSKDISRGAMIRSSELDSISSNAKTEYEYIMLSDIQDNILETGKHYITEIERRYQRYVVANGDIIISKIGSPLKCAIAQPEEGQTLLASSNMFIIRLNKRVIDPYFFMAFLESETGKKQLKNICMGVSVSTVSLDGLNNMIIPCPPLDEQKEIAEKYKAAINRINLLKKELESALNNIGDVFDK